jgi:hypothetical protein
MLQVRTDFSDCAARWYTDNKRPDKTGGPTRDIIMRGRQGPKGLAGNVAGIHVIKKAAK